MEDPWEDKGSDKVENRIRREVEKKSGRRGDESE